MLGTAGLRALVLEIAGQYAVDSGVRADVRLAGAPPTPRPSSDSGAWWGVRLRGATVPDLVVETAQRPGRASHSVDPKVALAGWYALVARLTGSRDITIGIPPTDQQPGPEPVDLPVRVCLLGDPTLAVIAERAQAAWQEAKKHAPVPTEAVQHLTDGPHLAVRFAAGPPKAAHITHGSLRWTIDEPAVRATNGEVTLWADSTTFQGGSRLLDRLAQVVAADPDTRLSELPVLTAHERRVLAEANATDAPYPRDKCLHQLIEEQVERTPKAIAVTAGGEHLSYRDLDRSANRLAHYLRAAGVGPERMVGILAARRIQTVVAMLAVLKGGGAYVPLDPDQPAPRLRLMTAGLDLVVAPHDLTSRVPGAVDGTAVSADFPERRLENLALPDNLAYVIYTSGSTGEPKGVLVPRTARSCTPQRRGGPTAGSHPARTHRPCRCHSTRRRRRFTGACAAADGLSCRPTTRLVTRGCSRCSYAKSESPT